MKSLVFVLATWCGSGLAPVASGTFGTLAAIPLYLLVAPLSLPSYLAFLAGFIVLACWVAGRAEEQFGKHDAGEIVIDEVAGFLLTMVAVTPTWPHVVAGFFLFRFFDIVKPPPARQIDRHMRSGTGVVLDDLAAGVYACGALHLLVRWL
jgi:phosphatidylglycerophosphatase A